MFRHLYRFLHPKQESPALFLPPQAVQRQSCGNLSPMKQREHLLVGSVQGSTAAVPQRCQCWRRLEQCTHTGALLFAPLWKFLRLLYLLSYFYLLGKMMRIAVQSERELEQCFELWFLLQLLNPIASPLDLHP